METIPLEELRKELDQIDNSIAELLSRRAELVLEVKKTKKSSNIDIYSPTRERQILDRVLNLVPTSKFPREAFERIFSNIISASRSLIGELQVSFVGPEYSLGHEAALNQFGETLRFLPEPSVEEIFKQVERGDVNFGVVPAELPSGGIAVSTFDALLDSSLVIIAEISLRERFALVGSAAALSSVKRVYADAHSFVRTTAWLRSALPLAELVLTENTDLALQKALANTGSDLESAAVVLQSAAERRGLKVLAGGLGEEGGAARYLVLGRNIPAPTGHDKTSLAISSPERTGVLRDVLQPFAEHGVTLLQIDSRSKRHQTFEYVFFLEAVGHEQSPALSAAIDQLKKADFPVKVLGSYPLVCR